MLRTFGFSAISPYSGLCGKSKIAKSIYEQVIFFGPLKKVFLFLGETVTDDECQQFILDADMDGDGKINYEEFYNMMSQKLY